MNEPIKYTYKGNEYLFLQYGKMKDIESGIWHTAVFYKDKMGITYCRERWDFEAKFQLVK